MYPESPPPEKDYDVLFKTLEDGITGPCTVPVYCCMYSVINLNSVSEKNGA